jgi:hypothetical protein
MSESTDRTPSKRQSAHFPTDSTDDELPAELGQTLTRTRSLRGISKYLALDNNAYATVSPNTSCTVFPSEASHESYQELIALQRAQDQDLARQIDTLYGSEHNTASRDSDTHARSDTASSNMGDTSNQIRELQEAMGKIMAAVTKLAEGSNSPSSGSAMEVTATSTFYRPAPIGINNIEQSIEFIHNKRDNFGQKHTKLFSYYHRFHFTVYILVRIRKKDYKYLLSSFIGF